MKPLIYTLLGLLAMACDEAPGDVAADAGADAGDAEPPAFEPDPPAPPDFRPCPGGWRETTDEDGVVICDPWGDEGPLSCAIDEVHLPGTTGCATVGTPCGDGAWAEDLPAGATIVHVDPAAGAGADGTATHPYTTIDRALQDANDGDVIALARGSYDETVTLTRGVTLWGACTAETILAPAESSDDAVVDVFGEGAGLRNLRVEGERPGIRVFESADAVVLESIVVSEAVEVGVESSGGVQASSVVVRGIRGGAAHLGTGIAVIHGAALLDRVAALDSDGWGIVATFGASMSVTDFVVQGTLGGPWSGRRIGVSVLSGAEVHIERAVLFGNEGPGLWVGDGRSFADATDLVIVGGGVQSHDQSEVTLTRVRIEAPVQSGLLALDSTVTLADVLVRNAVPVAVQGDLADGAVFGNGTVGRLDRVLLSGNERLGLLAAAPGTDLQGADLRVVKTRSLTQRGDTGHGIEASAGARLVLERVALEDARGAGLIAIGNGTVVEATDVRIARTGPRRCAPDACPGGEGGAGVVSEGGRAVLSSFVIADNALAGGIVGPLGTLELHEGEVRGNPVGVNVQNEDLDLEELRDGVRYDNQRNFDSQFLPIPGANELPSDEPVAPDVPLGIEVRRVGAPRWDAIDVHLFAAPVGFTPDDGVEAATAAALLDPARHPFVNELEARPGIAHEGPWAEELAEGVAASVAVEGSTFDRAQFELPSGVWMGCMLVPAADGPSGRSSDFDDGPILPDEDLPIVGTQMVFRDGEVFDPSGGFLIPPVSSLEGVGPYEGWSHLPVLYWENEVNAPPDAGDMSGDYVVVLSMRDATGAGWDVVAHYEIGG